MNCHETSSIPGTPLTQGGPIILVGNPNVGKSVIFGHLTGRYVTVANYPGTTVELTHGALPDGTPIIDTPGINTLNGNSDDERVTRELLYEKRSEARAVIQVADAKNLSRALTLTLQLLELGVPLILTLNMVDEAKAHGLEIDTAKLAERLGIQVIATVATRGEGLEQLPQAIQKIHAAAYTVKYEPLVEASLEKLQAALPQNIGYSRVLALRLLSGDETLRQQFNLNGSLTQLQDTLAEHYQRPFNLVIAQQRYRSAQELLEGIVTEKGGTGHDWGRRLSRWTTHPVAGWPILLLILYVVYKFVGELGAGTLVGFMEETLFGQWINPLVTNVVDTVLPVPFIHDLLVGQYGLLTMALTYGLAIVLPIVTTFFIAFSLLEDSGYLPRLAVMLNRAFKMMGLNGKAVLPMVLGLGCDTMATMTTRILETRKERILVTLLLALGVPCSAQLGVILGMTSILSSTGILIWGSVVVGTMLAVGLLAAKLLPGERSDFILELPPIRWPQPGHIVVKTLARLEWYLKEVLPLFLLGTLILFALDKTGVLVLLEQLASPIVVGMLGLPAKATGAFLIGFLRRDYGAAGLFVLALDGQMTSNQLVVSLVVVTLFIPCIANVMIIVKEYGGRVAAAVAGVVFPLAFLIGGLVNLILSLLRLSV